MLDRFRHFVEYDFTGSDQPWSVAAILKRSPPRFQALNGTPLLPRWKKSRDLGEVGDFRSLPMCSWENLWKAFHTRSWVAILTLKSRVLWRDGMSEAVDSLIPTTGALLPPHLMGQVRSLRHLAWSLWITSGSISCRVVVMVALRVLEPLCFLQVRIWEDYWYLRVLSISLCWVLRCQVSDFSLSEGHSLSRSQWKQLTRQDLEPWSLPNPIQPLRRPKSFHLIKDPGSLLRATTLWSWAEWVHVYFILLLQKKHRKHIGKNGKNMNEN